MDQNNMYAVFITAITVLGSTTAFRYYDRRAQKRERDESFMRHDCKDRIAKLEALLEESAEEKNKMRQTILELTAAVAELRTKVEFLQERNRIGL